MNDTEPRTTPDGPRVTPDQMRDIERLRRSTADRRIAGVAGGLGRHFDVDPTLIRVLLVVLTLFGGAGLLIYLAVWLLVPDDNQRSAPLGVSPELRNALLLTAALVAAVIAFGASWDTVGGVGFPLPGLVVPLLIIGAVVLFVNSRQQSAAPPSGSAPSGSAPMVSTPAPGDLATAPTGTTSMPHHQTFVGSDPAPTSATPTSSAATPLIPPYVPPAVRSRRGPILLWPTLALVLVGWGILGTYDASGGQVADGSYAALALGLIGLALVVGTWVGRAGGLILTGLVASAALMATTFIGFTGGLEGWRDPQSVSMIPATAADVPSDNSFGTGEFHLDLTHLSDPEALDGRRITISAKAADVSVLVPRDVNAVVTGTVDKAGEVVVGDVSRQGIRPQTLQGRLGDDPDHPTIYIDIDIAVGAIAVRN